MAEIESTTVVSFNDSDSDYIFNVETDGELNVDSSGDEVTSFGPGDTIYLVVNKSSNVKITDVVITDGTIASYAVNQTRVADTETNLFVERDSDDPETYTISKIPSSAPVVGFYGLEGTVTSEASSIGEYTYTSDQSTTPFIASFDYEYTVQVYKVVAPEMTLDDDESYTISIVFYIEVD